MVLVSKADVLNPSDRERAVDFVCRQIFSEVNVKPPVHLVSVVGNDVRLCDERFESVLRPNFDLHRELTAASLKRKIGGLCQALLATLNRRAETGLAARSDVQNEKFHTLFHFIPASSAASGSIFQSASAARCRTSGFWLFKSAVIAGTASSAADPISARASKISHLLFSPTLDK